MMPKWYFRTHKMHATIRLSAIVLAALGGVLAYQSPCAGSDKAPDWLRAAAQEKLPEYPKQDEAVAIVLLDEEQTTVKDNGKSNSMSGESTRSSAQRRATPLTVLRSSVSTMTRRLPISEPGRLCQRAMNWRSMTRMWWN
jgi:hypothetical protein